MTTTISSKRSLKPPTARKGDFFMAGHWNKTKIHNFRQQKGYKLYANIGSPQ
jgi:hypothetical protein